MLLFFAHTNYISDFNTMLLNRARRNLEVNERDVSNTLNKNQIELIEYCIERRLIFFEGEPQGRSKLENAHSLLH